MSGPGTPHNAAISASLQNNPDQGPSGPAGSPPLAAPQPRLPQSQQQWTPLNPAGAQNAPPAPGGSAESPMNQLPPMPASVAALLNMHHPPHGATSSVPNAAPPAPSPAPNPLQEPYSHVSSSLLSALHPFGNPQLGLFPGQGVQPLFGGGHHAILQQLKASSDLQRIVQIHIQYLVSSLLQSGLTIDQISFLMAQGQPPLGSGPLGFPSVPLQPPPPTTPQPHSGLSTPSHLPNQGHDGSSPQVTTPKATPRTDSPQEASAEDKQPQSTQSSNRTAKGGKGRKARFSLDPPSPPEAEKSEAPPLPQLPPSLGISSQDLLSMDLPPSLGLDELQLQFHQRQLKTTTAEFQKRLLQRQQEMDALTKHRTLLQAQARENEPPLEPQPSAAPSIFRHVDTDRFRHVVPESLTSPSQLPTYVATNGAAKPTEHLGASDGAEFFKPEGVLKRDRATGRPRTRNRVDNLNSEEDFRNYSRDMSITVPDSSHSLNSENDDSVPGKTSREANGPPGAFEQRNAFFTRFVEVNPAAKRQWTPQNPRQPGRRGRRKAGVTDDADADQDYKQDLKAVKTTPENKLPKKRGRKPGSQNKPPPVKVGLDGDSKTRREARALERRQRDTRLRGRGASSAKNATDASEDEALQVASSPVLDSSLPPPVQPQGVHASFSLGPHPKNYVEVPLRGSSPPVDGASTRRSLKGNRVNPAEPLAARYSGAPPPVMPLNARGVQESDESAESEESGTGEQSEEEEVEQSEEDDWAPAVGTAAYKAKRRAEQRDRESKRRKGAKSSGASSSESSPEEETPRRTRLGNGRRKS